MTHDLECHLVTRISSHTSPVGEAWAGARVIVDRNPRAFWGVTVHDLAG